MALPANSIPLLSEQLLKPIRKPLIWLSFQECTGCTESVLRSHAPSLESLIFDFVSLDYHHTLQAAAGKSAELAREETEARHAGEYLLVVDGSVPLANDGACSTIAGRSNLETLQSSVRGAEAVFCVGSCSAWGGLPAAQPNPTDARSVADLMVEGHCETRPLVRLPGCPPLPMALGSVLAYYLTFSHLPELDAEHRPLSIYGNTVHDRCSRLNFYNEEKFAESFDDEGARQGWCLYKLGCKGPVTHNACSLHKWNQGTSWPVESGIRVLAVPAKISGMGADSIRIWSLLPSAGRGGRLIRYREKAISMKAKPCSPTTALFATSQNPGNSRRLSRRLLIF